MPGPSSGPAAPRVTPASSSHAATQVDVSTQVDLLLDGGGSHGKQPRGATPLYSREDIIEQYCINNRQLNVVTEKSGSGSIFGCLTSRGPSPCSSAAKASILSACVRSAPSDENLFDAAPYPFPAHTRYTMPSTGRSWRDREPHLPIEIMYQQPYSTYPKYLVRYEERRSYDDEDSSYFRRRPKSICTDAKRYTWVPEDEDPARLERPRSVLANYPSHHQPLVSALHSSIHQSQQSQKPKHVSFARSHTLTSFDIPRTKSPPRPPDDVGPINPERLIDSKPTRPGTPNSIAPETPEPRILILEKQPKRGTMKAQATQTEVPTGRGRVPTLSPRTIHRVKMVSQGAQTNGILNGRKLHKSYSEAGQLGTPLGGPSANKDDQHDHEPLQRTQSEEPPKSPYLLEDVPSPRKKLHQQQQLTNGDAESHEIQGTKRKDSDPDDKEILIDFKPAPVSPDARSLLNEMATPYRRYVSLQKTLSDGEIQVERRELIGETGEPSYPHSCRRNHPDSWAGKLRQPVQFSSTPDDLSLLRISPPDDHNDEEFHENIVRRGLFRKRSVSLEDGVQVLSTNEYILPRSLPTSPTSPTSAAAPPRHRPHTGVTRTVQYLYANQRGSPFASSDSLANDLTRDGSDGIWNESQATVLQADSLALLTPSSRRRHLLMLQHQQRSSMDTDALDAEDEMEPIYSTSCSPRIRLEVATPVASSHSIEPSYVNTNGQRQRLSYMRRSPAPPLSQPHSQSSSEFGLSRSGTTDISETSTTDDYVTANTSTGTGTTTGGTNSSHSRPHYKLAGPSATASATATTADGSSFESASSVYSLARSEAMLDESSSPRISKDKSDSAYSVHQQSPPKSTSSSSSGSYDLEDANPQPLPQQQEIPKCIPAAQHTVTPTLTKQETEERLAWTEEERRRRKQAFTLDVTGGESISPEQESQSPRQQRSRTHHQRSSPHRNGASKRSQAAARVSPQREEAQTEDGTHVPTSDDSSCSHRCPLHHHHHLHPGLSPSEQQQQQRYRRSRESPRRKSASRLSDRRRSNEDKNAALTGSLPRRRSRGLEYLYGSSSEASSRLSPGGGIITATSGRYGGSLSPSPSSASTAVAVSVTTSSGGGGRVSGAGRSASSAEVRLRAISAESLRSASPGSDSVFYAVDERDPKKVPQAHCHQCGREVVEEIVQPPAGFADSPEGSYRPAQKHSSGQRLFKKFDKRYRSEDRSERRHHRDSMGRSDVRAKSEERSAESSRHGEDFNRKRFHTRSTEASMEILTGREDEGAYVEPYTSSEWIYIGEFEESHVWKRPDSRDGDDELECHRERRGSQESTESERMFRKKYQAATLRMVHRKSVGEMYKRIQTKCFESDKRVIVRREAGGEFGFRIHGSKPVVVSSIEPDTPAESSGLEVGDIVMSVNGKSVMDATHSEVVRLAHSGSDVLELEVARTCDVLAPQSSGGSASGCREVRQEPAICSGYLWRKAKSGNSTPGGSSASSRSKWVRRWFALRRDNCLYYYKTDSDSQPVGAVMLLKYDAELTHDTKPHSFAIRKRGAPTLYLAADSDEAAKRWCSLILEAVDRNEQADTCWLDGSLSLRELAPGMIQRPDCAGYLSKQHERVRRCSSPTGWARRYCLLKDAALYFYEDSDSEQAFGVALIHGYRVHASAPTSGGRRYAFELQPPDPTQRIYTFAADSEMDKKRWIAALEYSIDRWIKIA